MAKTKGVVVKNGKYKGQVVNILGNDFKVLGRSLYGIRNDLAIDYMKRMAMNSWSTLDKRFICELPNHELVALNKKEIG